MILVNTFVDLHADYMESLLANVALYCSGACVGKYCTLVYSPLIDALGCLLVEDGMADITPSSILFKYASSLHSVYMTKRLDKWK